MALTALTLVKSVFKYAKKRHILQNNFCKSFIFSSSVPVCQKADKSKMSIPVTLTYFPATSKISAFFVALTLFGGSVYSFCESETDDSKQLDISETMAHLKFILNPFRTKIREHGKLAPNVLVSVEGTEHCCGFQIPRKANPLRVLAEVTKQLQRLDRTIEVHSSLTDGPAGEVHLSLVMKGLPSSILFRSIPSEAGYFISFYREGGFTRSELEAIKQTYETAHSFYLDTTDAQDGFPQVHRFHFGPAIGGSDDLAELAPLQRKRFGGKNSSDPLETLRGLGVMVFDKENGEKLDWDSLAGYNDIKNDIEDVLILALKHPEEYDQIARGTRSRYETNRPRAVLFEGPPGTGKTLTARIIANRANKPLVHVNVENVTSKWYGESEQNLAKVFEACDDMGGAIIFIDEIDALATSRDSLQMHEATRRMLSVILQKVEGFEGSGVNTLICATNRKRDLDAALLSRFDLMLRFELPNQQAREAIAGRYAKHLSKVELQKISLAANGFAARDIKEVCEHVERRWASRVIRHEVKGLPAFEEYMRCVQERQEGKTKSPIAEV